MKKNVRNNTLNLRVCDLCNVLWLHISLLIFYPVKVHFNRFAHKFDFIHSLHQKRFIICSYFLGWIRTYLIQQVYCNINLINAPNVIVTLKSYAWRFKYSRVKYYLFLKPNGPTSRDTRRSTIVPNIIRIL